MLLQSLAAVRAFKRSLCVVVLSVVLASCSVGNEPPRAIVIEALQSQILATQVSIAQSLDLDPVAEVPSVSRVRVDRQESLQVEGERFLHLVGTFDWQLPRDSVRVDSAFELYLQKGKRNEGWTLARPFASSEDDFQHWSLYPLGLPTS